jgi:hypothetical protein
MAKKHTSFKTQLHFDAAATLAASFLRGAQYKAARALEGLRTGILGHLVKANLAHGEFKEWVAKNATVAFLSYRSLQMKMQVAEAFREDCTFTADALEASGFIRLGIREGSHEHAGVFGVFDDSTFAPRKCAVFEAAKKWVGDRGITQIYRDYGISEEKAAATPNKRPAHEIEQMHFEDYREGWLQIKHDAERLVADPMISALPAPDRFDLAQTILPIVRNFAETTADWTPEQRNSVIAICTEINHALRSRKASSR